MNCETYFRRYLYSIDYQELKKERGKKKMCYMKWMYFMIFLIVVLLNEVGIYLRSFFVGRSGTEFREADKPSTCTMFLKTTKKSN